MTPQKRKNLFRVAAVLLVILPAGVWLVVSLLAGEWLWIGVSREQRAKLDVEKIRAAVMKYQVAHGYFPQSLEVLCELDPGVLPALLEPATLIDPWGQHYQYEPQGRYDPVKGPLIYSDGPPGQNKRISTWYP